MRGVFSVDVPNRPRWALALDLLRRGDAISLGRVTLRRTDREIVEAAVRSSRRLENLSADRAYDDLLSARSRVERLLVDDEGFREAVGESAIEYTLVDDYDTGSAALCRLVGDRLEWLTPPPHSR
jgi:hypothetical protein